MDQATEPSSSQTLQDRLDFIGIDDAARQRLQSLSSIVERSIGPALDTFYTKVRETPETAAFFSDESHLQSAKSRQVNHWGIIAAGAFGDNYVNGVNKVGMAHARIGLEPSWYIGGYGLIIEQLIASVLAEKWPELNKKNKTTSDETAADIAVLVKSALLDMDYAISVYLKALADERERARAERRKAETDRQMALDALANALSELATGDLEVRLSDDIPDEFVEMAHSYNQAVESLRVTLQSSRRTSEKIVDGISKITEATGELSDRTVKQAASLEQSSAALHELTESVRSAAESSENASSIVSGAQADARTSGELVANAVTAMGEIEKSSDQIARIIGVIDEIAFQTNLLALNASVEAARAGDAGRGFAVVAQEVRALAQRSADSAREIKQLISDSQGHVNQGVSIVGQTGEALSKIINRIEEIAGIVTQIANQSREQSIGLDEVSTAINDMDQITQHNSSMAENTSEAMNTLNDEARHMAAEMARFKVRDPELNRNSSGNYRRNEDRAVSGRRENAA